MTLQELIELAILDAMALLDEDERGLFEDAFQSASPSVQAQVRREQTRLSQIQMLLPDVEPPADLRAAVITAVRLEIARSGAAGSDELVVPLMVKSRGVSPWWRAASAGLAAALLVLAVTMFIFQSQHQRAIDQCRSDAFFALLSEEFGPTFVRDVLFSGDTDRILFVSDDPAFRGQASVFINPDWAQAKFFCHAITTPEGQKYRLAIVDDNDRVVQELTAFTSNGGLLSRDVALQFGNGHSLAIVTSVEAPGHLPRIISRGKMEG
jgi:hypothetical protein